MQLFLGQKFSDVINFVDSDRLLIGSFERKRKESRVVFAAASRLLFPARLIARQLNIEVNDIKAVIVSVF